jgi:hypothetical protein
MPKLDNEIKDLQYEIIDGNTPKEFLKITKAKIRKLQRQLRKVAMEGYKLESGDIITNENGKLTLTRAGQTRYCKITEKYLSILMSHKIFSYERESLKSIHIFK